MVCLFASAIRKGTKPNDFRRAIDLFKQNYRENREVFAKESTRYFAGFNYSSNPMLFEETDVIGKDVRHSICAIDIY